eukprot:gnl/Chilomastix_cuspidata/1027.p4 GENE.gnl/Chilomastix_cuspidata/1027~~gnl/Chilomastix_cuspidata/1027.p4  ORF type:complete len:245 (+),score=4.55 gnl/Chilomastix_cuspidata/1027:351-1085(+)
MYRPPPPPARGGAGRGESARRRVGVGRHSGAPGMRPRGEAGGASGPGGVVWCVRRRARARVCVRARVGRTRARRRGLGRVCVRVCVCVCACARARTYTNTHTHGGHEPGRLAVPCAGAPRSAPRLGPGWVCCVFAPSVAGRCVCARSSARARVPAAASTPPRGGEKAGCVGRTRGRDARAPGPRAALSGCGPGRVWAASGGSPAAARARHDGRARTHGGGLAGRGVPRGSEGRAGCGGVPPGVF